MRKTRLVILPTKCLHQMGFLLLFLSCPVIGDWGRIRPESENSHNAIQIDREGTCGFERDPPGEPLGFPSENESKRCRLSEDLDSNTIAKKTVFQKITYSKSEERRISVQRRNQQRNIRTSERRIPDERDVRRTIRRNVVDNRKDFRRDVQSDGETVRTRGVESRRSLRNRNDRQIRSSSLSRLGNKQAVKKQRSITSRNINEAYSRRQKQELRLSERTNEKQYDQRMEPRRPLNRELSNERRENERAVRMLSDGRERETIRLTRPRKAEEENVRRESDRSTQELSRKKKWNDLTRRQVQEKTQKIRERNDRRLSLARKELIAAKEIDIAENGRRSDRILSEKRLFDIRKSRGKRGSQFTINRSDQREKLARMSRDDNRRDIESKRFVSLYPKIFERNYRERRLVFNERVEGISSRKVTAATMLQNSRKTLEPNSENKKLENKELFKGVTEWIDLKSYENLKTADWTTNCIIGAVVYFLTARQIKAA